eukprot:4678135-Pyramimonas_sp.AAC.1
MRLAIVSPNESTMRAFSKPRNRPLDGHPRRDLAGISGRLASMQNMLVQARTGRKRLAGVEQFLCEQASRPVGRRPIIRCPDDRWQMPLALLLETRPPRVPVGDCRESRPNERS